MNNIVLNDKELREALKDWLFRKSMKPKKIIEELKLMVLKIGFQIKLTGKNFLITEFLL